jgi:hypothetical protein
MTTPPVPDPDHRAAPPLPAFIPYCTAVVLTADGLENGLWQARRKYLLVRAILTPDDPTLRRVTPPMPDETDRTAWVREMLTTVLDNTEAVAAVRDYGRVTSTSGLVKFTDTDGNEYSIPVLVWPARTVGN